MEENRMGKRSSDLNGAPAGTSRRDFLKSGAAGLATAGLAKEWLPGASSLGLHEGDETFDRLERAKRDPTRRTLIKGGVIISMDPAVGNFARGDVLIEGKKIVSV